MNPRAEGGNKTNPEETPENAQNQKPLGAEEAPVPAKAPDNADAMLS